MHLVGHCLGIRSERRLCEEVRLNLAYRWFCWLNLTDRVPDHSTFSKNRHRRCRDGYSPELPKVACDAIIDLGEQLVALHTRVNWYGRRMTAAAKSEPRIAWLQTISGIGPITASAIVATVGYAEQFRSGRDLPTWLYVSNRETNPALTKALQKGGVYIHPHRTKLPLVFSEKGTFRPKTDL
jgi:transposase